MVLAFAGPALSQTQLGSDIEGEAARINRATLSPCPAMARGWRLGRL